MNATLERFAGTPILIAGDVMLDEYVWGEVNRISQEAPVPVVEAKTRTYAPGGASNVATNVVSLSGKALLGGVVGEDEPANQLKRLLTEASVDVSGLLPDAARPTTTKTRIIAHSQQVVRVDSEHRAPLSETMQNRLLAWMAAHLANVGACVVSDYGKGVFTPDFTQNFIWKARQAGKPVIVDPKGTDYQKYRGATVIKPNVHELALAIGRGANDEDDLHAAALRLLEIVEGSALLVTRGSEGMLLFQQGQTCVKIPPIPRNVYDSTGAGDTVVSALALALGSGADLETAARLANHAASIVVGKLGTASVTREELLEESKQ